MFVSNVTVASNTLISSPITALFATKRPPSVCNEPSVVDVASVVSSDFSIPEKVPVVAARAAKEPAAVEAPPITAPSIVPPLMSAVVTVPKLAIVVPAKVAVPSAALVKALEFAAVPRVVISK